MLINMKMDKPLVWLHGEIQTPPFSKKARLEAGYLLRMLQMGESLSLPHSRPLPSIRSGVHELRINDHSAIWRIVYRIDEDAIVIAEVFSKKSRKIPRRILELCRRRFNQYDELVGG